MEFTIFICLINDLKLLPQSLFSLLTLPKKMSPWKLRIIQMRIKKERNSEDATCRMYTSGSCLQKYWKNITKRYCICVFSLFTLPKKMSPWKWMKNHKINREWNSIMTIKTIASVSLLSLDPSKENVPWKWRNIQMRIKKKRNSEYATRRMYASGSGLQMYWKSELKNIASVYSLSWPFQRKCPHGSGELFR